MGKLSWYINRLRAMNVREVVWRLDQKWIEKQEASRFGKQKVNVGDVVFDPAFAGLRFDCNALGINFHENSSSNINCHQSDINLPLIGSSEWVPSVNTEVNLLKGPDYGKWPETFSYSLNYKQRDDLGDARTNWEKNRHFDWALLAKRLYVLSKNDNDNDDDNRTSYDNDNLFLELEREVTEWMEENPFLHGISWTSAMEFAIRSINWMYALAFLEKTRYVNSRVDGYKTKTIKTPEGSVSNCESEIESELSSSASQSSTDSFAAPIQPSGKKQEKPFVADERLDVVCGKLRNGIINITEYLTKHYSRFSSANNHLLVEATAIGLAGYAFGHKPWQELAVRILTEELPKQNYSDGVNKELSLHYQTFGMEAYLLLAHAMQKNAYNENHNDNDNCHADEGFKTKTIKTPEGSVSNEESEIESKLSSSAASSSTGSSTASSNPSGKKQEINLSWKSWMPMLMKEAEFVAHSTWREKVVCEFGDDDEGKILDLEGRPKISDNDNENDNLSSNENVNQAHNDNCPHQWEWVLQLASLVTGVRYSRFEEVCENTRWLFTEEEIEAIMAKPYFANDNDDDNDNCLSSRVFAEGGNSFLRDKEDRVLIGIDHAELGFGSIAAHGHADALSFQMLVDGEVVFADPGTYIYHCWIEERDKFRKTINHNTLCLIDETKTRKTPSTDAGSMSPSAAEVSASSENKFSSATVTSPSGIVADTASIDGNKQEKPFSIECFKDQSKMLGAFMWGERANCRLVDYKIGDDKDVLVAEHDGYKPIVHRRKFEWDKVKHELRIEDTLTNEADYAVTFMIGANCKVVNDHCIETPTSIIEMQFEHQDRVQIEDAEVSPEYGVKVPSKAIRVYGHEKKMTTRISVRFK